MDFYLTFKYYGMDQHLYWVPVWLKHENVLWFPCSFAHIIKISTLLWWNRILILYLANLCVQRIDVSQSDDRVCWMSGNLPVRPVLQNLSYTDLPIADILYIIYQLYKSPNDMYIVSGHTVYCIRYTLV